MEKVAKKIEKMEVDPIPKNMIIILITIIIIRDGRITVLTENYFRKKSAS